MTYLVIGAGPAGLAALRAFRQQGLPVEAVEQHADIGGQWLYGAENSAVYATTHLISSKGTTAFLDYPMPEDWPPYPHHAQVQEYLRAFARDHDLYPLITFNCRLERLQRSDAGWLAHFSDGRSRQYDGVVIANGHLTEPDLPELPGSFDGEILHSKVYKTPDIFAGKRVLVVGAGNTGCDIVVDAVHHAAQVLWSVRGGNHFVPKFIAGRPADEGNHQRKIILPRWLRSWLHEKVLRILVGPPERFGLPKPAHRLYDRTPIVNSLVLQHLGQGDVQVRTTIREVQGRKVVFADGRSDEVDLILLATGYRIVFPFLDTGMLNWRGAGPHLFMNIFPPRDIGLFVVGLLEGAGIGWPGRDLQARLVAAYIKARQSGTAAAGQFSDAVNRYCAAPPPGGRGAHGIFIDFLEYKAELQQAIARLAV